ncbi:MAG: hypothetical protein IPH53_11135 [Flavobacteriales bacterium]|nr:hypothetical protein [Flavobacteriales bacterium]
MEVPREDLYARIDQRVARMMEQGLLEEARAPALPSSERVEHRGL